MSQQVLECYLDESTIDDGSEVAVVAGLVLEPDRFTWLDIDWQKALARHNMPVVHMREFGPSGKLKEYPETSLRSLFTDLVAIITEYKRFSIAATLSRAQYLTHFARFAKTHKRVNSIHSTCFLLLAVFQGRQADHDGYGCNINFVLDDFTKNKQEVIGAHRFLVDTFQKEYPTHVGALDFGDDKKVSALQAADVVAWTVRRIRAGLPLRKGFEPLAGILNDPHLEKQFAETWMEEIATAIDNLK
jgi:hypothetical protein